jgi:hypothetical protein
MNILFQSYESKPIVRQAFQIKEGMEIYQESVPQSTWRVGYMGSSVLFKAYQPPVVGDWIVRLTEEDTYHCTDTVFRERNIVPE